MHPSNTRSFVGRSKKVRRGKSSGLAGQWRAARPAVAVLLTVTMVVAALAGLGWLGNEALRGIGSRERYRVPFADIQCPAPPGLGRPQFLSEVRYLSRFPDSFHSLEPGDQQRLAEAFAMHPWVESVGGIEVEPGNVVRIDLKLRQPVLAVEVLPGEVRMVDRHGILLPDAEVPESVARLLGIVPAPQTPSGQVWDNPTVKRAVELVNTYSPIRLERRWTGWRLEQRDGTVLIVLQ